MYTPDQLESGERTRPQPTPRGRWARNLLLLATVAAGITLLGGSVLSRSRLSSPAPEAIAAFAAADVRDAATRVDAEFAARFESRGLEPAPRADELAVARRISLGLTGTVPSLEEIRALERLPRDRRVAWWVARVLEDRRYADYVGERLARAYVGTENGPFLVYRRRRFVTWLADRLHENTPYDQLVRRLLSDQGIWTSNPSVNFLTATLDSNEDKQPDEIRLAGRTARAFLGMRIDCLQCHDDRLGNVGLGSPATPRAGRQSDFHQLAAFFSEARVSLLGVTDASEDYRYQYLHADQPEVVPPAVPFLENLRPTEGPRREQLARWVTHPQNKAFARAVVNRVWALLCGKPLVEPIDDIPLDCQAVPGLDTLADDFVQHGFDLRRLIRVIVATDTFQRDSRAPFEVTAEHERYWAVFPITRLRPEQVAGALLQSCALHTIDANSHVVFQMARYLQQIEFVRRYGDTGEDEFEDRGGTIPQRLLLMNGKLVRERTADNLLANGAARIARLASRDESAVTAAFLAVLSRRPEEEELRHFAARLNGTEGLVRSRQLEDLYWVLINSTEFSWNH